MMCVDCVKEGEVENRQSRQFEVIFPFYKKKTESAS
jgi:hypothetical protein